MQGVDPATRRRRVLRTQSAADFIVTYGWVLLIVSLVLVLLYTYTTLPPSITPGTCSFGSGIGCTDIVLNTNSITLYLVNSQSFPISAPTLYASINNQNTITASCVPNFVLPGGSMVCVVSALPVSVPLGASSSGNLYLSAAYCGLASNYATSGNCGLAPVLTYSGSFSAHSEPVSNPIPYASNYVIYFSARNVSQYFGPARDPLYAQVMLGNYPVLGATVSFSLNNYAFSLQPTATATNATGNALSYVWGGTGPASVIVTASLGSATGTPSNTCTIQFGSPTWSPTSISSPASAASMDQSQPLTVSVTTPNTGLGPYTYSWAQTSGYTCPSGFSGSSAYTFSYTPGGTGTCEFTVTVTDSTTPVHNTYTATTPLITVSSTLTATSASEPSSGSVGSQYTISVTAPTTGTSPYTYSWAVAPTYSCPGFTSASTSSFPYTPSTTGTCEFNVIVTDSASPTHESYTATASPAMTITQTVYTTQCDCGCSSCGGSPLNIWTCSNTGSPAGCGSCPWGCSPGSASGESTHKCPPC